MDMQKEQKYCDFNAFCASRLAQKAEKFYFCAMSDGNFNRALLPHTPYASGLRTGRQQERMLALKAFEEWLRTSHPGLSDDDIRQHTADFRDQLARLGG